MTANNSLRDASRRSSVVPRTVTLRVLALVWATVKPGRTLISNGTPSTVRESLVTALTKNHVNIASTSATILRPVSLASHCLMVVLLWRRGFLDRFGFRDHDFGRGDSR